MIGNLLQPELVELIEKRDFTQLREILCHFPIPEISVNDWRLRIEGEVEAPFELTYDELRAMESRTIDYTGTAISPAGTNIVIRNCTFRHFYTAILNNQNPVGVLAQDNVAGVLAGYFIYDDGSDHVYLANKANDSVWQHNIRIYASRVLCYKNDLTNKPPATIEWE